MAGVKVARLVDGSAGRSILCCLCGHRIGEAGRVEGSSADSPWRVRKHWLSYLPDLVRLKPDAEDGLPRYGLRAGAFRKGRDPVRRPAAAAFGYEPLEEADPGNSIGMTEFARYYAKCVNCGPFNLVDLERLAESE